MTPDGFRAVHATSRSDTGGTPLVSVVVPAFNAERTLDETLRSAATQTYPYLEILVVDDGSTDATGEVAAAFCAREPRARLIVKANGGVGSARNAGIAAARGEYVAPLDADDLWHPAKIARQVEAARGAPEPVGFVYCWSRLVDGAGRAVGCGDPFRVQGRAFDRLVHRNFVGNGSAPLLRRAAVLAVGGYDERRGPGSAEGCEDLLLQLRLAERYPVAVAPAYLVGYRIVGSGMSRDAERMFRSFRAAVASVGDPISKGPAYRWTLAHRRCLLAERRAAGGDWAGCAGLLLLALAGDPRRTAGWLAYRATRRLRRLAGVGADARPPLPFGAWSIAEHGPGDPWAIKWWEARLVHLDRKRMTFLAQDASKRRRGVARSGLTSVVQVADA